MKLHPVEDATYASDAPRLARQLLTEARLVAGDRRYRIEELELYFWGARHRDPFAHRDPIQDRPGRWYFHRRGGAYKGGSFKGLDLTFGPSGTSGGLLLRSVRDEADGRLVCGPSLLVDALLEATGHAHVAALDAASDALAADSPLRLEATEPRALDILRTGRVGLTLKRCALPSDKPAYLLVPDRYLVDPRLPKGRVYTLVALAQAGSDTATIGARTGSPRAAIERTVAAYRAGLSERDITPYLGRSWNNQELARLHGVWEREFG